MDPTTVKRIKESPWSPAGEGTLACRIVLWEREPGTGHPDGQHPYCTHMEVDDPSQQSRSFYHGHYDMTLVEVAGDYTRRCKLLGVESGEKEVKPDTYRATEEHTISCGTCRRETPHQIDAEWSTGEQLSSGYTPVKGEAVKYHSIICGVCGEEQGS